VKKRNERGRRGIGRCKRNVSNVLGQGMIGLLRFVLSYDKIAELMIDGPRTRW
jgi:hypothetical protein